MPVVAAGAGVHCGDDHHRAGVGKAPADPGDGDLLVFDWLAEHLKGLAGEFGELVKKQNAVVGKRNFTWMRSRAAARQPNCRDGVVGRTKRADGNQGAVLFEEPATE